MKRIVLFVSGLVMGIALLSCTGGKEKFIKAIRQAESELISKETGTIAEEKAAELIRLYDGYAKKYADDTLSVTYLQKAGEICMNTNQPYKAIEFFDRVRTGYPDHRKAADCLFLKAFVYETLLNDLGNAQKYYLEFIKSYPAHDFADDAQAMLDNLGKSPEEVISAFEEKSE